MSSIPAINTPIYLYDIRIKNMYLVAGGTGDTDHLDFVTKKIADFLKEKGLTEKVIDLRFTQAGYNEHPKHEGCFIEFLSIHLLTNYTLPDEYREQLLSRIEQLAADRIPATFEHFKDRFSFSMVESEYCDFQLSVESIWNKRSFSVIKFPIPRLSEGPVTGMYMDSWGNACRTAAAKQWLVDNGVDIPQGHISLCMSSGLEIHSIGLVRNR